MKIFTVGMDEKSPMKDIPIESNTVTLSPAPIIAIEKKRNLFKCYAICLGALLFILLSTVTMSKLLYYKISDDLGIPWLQLKHRIRIGCEDCMDARIIQSFYPQRSSRAFENSNNAASAVQAERLQTTGQVTQDKSVAQDFDWESLVGSRKVPDSRIDFFNKIIPKIEEQAEKSGIEGLMQVKLIQMDSFEPNQLLDSNENQIQRGSNMLKLNEFWTPSRSTLLNDLSRWNTIDNDESQMSANQFFGSEKDDVKGEPMLVFGPFPQSKQLQPLPYTWDGNDNLLWSNSPYPGFFDLIQQVRRQQSTYLKQSPFVGLNKYDNDKIAELRNIQRQMPITVMHQNPLPTWGISDQQDGNIPMGDSWLNSVQDEADNQWAQTNWQGQQQQQQQQQQQEHFRASYPQTWQVGMNQEYYQNTNDWDVQKANIPDDSDGKMTSPVFSTDNVNDIKNNVNDVWSQFLFNIKGRLQPLKVQKTVVEQSNLRAEPVIEQVEDQSFELQQQQVQPEINALPKEEFKQSSSVSTVFNGPDESASETTTRSSGQTNSGPFVRSENDNEEQLDLLNQERRELRIQLNPSDVNTSETNLKFINDDPNMDADVKQSDPINDDIGDRSSNPILFQVDEPIMNSADIDENLVK